MRLYILIRTDINPSIGKLMVHVGHICSRIVYANKERWFIREWIKDYHTIIILAVENLQELKSYYYKWNPGFPTRPAVMIEDAGFYELEEGTILMCGIGPTDKETAKNLGLDKLKLYKYMKNYYDRRLSVSK